MFGSFLILWPLTAAQAFQFPLTTGQRAQKLVEQGYERIIRGDYSGALGYCDEALKVRSDWAPAYICRSEARLWLKDPLSDRDARQAMRYDPKSGDPHRLLGLWEYEGGRYQAAIQNFSRALELSKLKPEGVTEVYYYRARARIKTNDLPGALHDINHGLGVLRGINGSYGDWSFYSLRAEVRRRQGDYEGADTDEKEVLHLIENRIQSHAGEAPELLRRRANSFALLGDFERAADEYGRILDGFHEGDVKTSLERVLALVMAGRYEGANRELAPILENEPRRPLVRRIRALLRAAAGDSVGAVADLDTFLSGTAASPEASLELRQALEQDGGALTQLEGWQSSAAPRDPKLWGRRALVHELLLEHDQAIALAGRALANDPLDAAAHLARGAAGLTGGRCPEASASLDWLVASRLDQGFFRWIRGECRCRIDDLDGCVDDLERATFLERAAKAPAMRLASQYRRWLDHRAAASTPEELSRGLKHYDHARSLGTLDAADELGRIQTLVDYAAVRPKEKRLQALKEAAAACRQLLAEDPEDEQLAETCLEIKNKFGGQKPRPLPKPGPATKKK
ncbi:MAG: tetratricopeptide repeat protein [Elusimicrobia bacterium]|nr:tetratricopeptide repeat protein [Elusimicrobiota bacterium]